jgi:TonB family protein
MPDFETPQNLQPLGPEPELHLLLNDQALDESLWKSLFRNIDEFFFPKKLPPLVLTSKPVPVRDIWGFYNYKKNGAFGSSIVHLLALALILAIAYLGRVVAVDKPKATVELIAPELPVLPPSSTKSGGGGGGGDRDKLQASAGRLPNRSLQPLAPPLAVVRNLHPKLEVDPTIVAPPLPQPNMPDLGNPLSHLPTVASNGMGAGGGIGDTGYGGGVGNGEGPGFGPGHGGGAGGGAYRVGGGVSAPKPIYAPDPEYSEEARKVKHMGTVVLWLVVGPDGKPRDIRVLRTLGLGLDEKAIEAVKNWRFEPAMKDGKPVAVQINVEVNFHLY